MRDLVEKSKRKVTGPGWRFGDIVGVGWYWYTDTPSNDSQEFGSAWEWKQAGEFLSTACSSSDNIALHRASVLG